MDTAVPNQLVAIVAGDHPARKAHRTRLESAGYVVETFRSAEEFLTSARRFAIGCLVLDVRSPGTSGLAVQTRLLAEKSMVPVIFTTGPAGDAAERRALAKGAAKSLDEPVDPDALLRAIRSASNHKAPGSNQ